MNNIKTLSELEEAILRHLQSTSASFETILYKFASEDLEVNSIMLAINELHKERHYITTERLVKSGIYDLNKDLKDDDIEEAFVITSLGKGYLARATANFTSFSNISNSNVAHNSPNATQSINFSEQPQDVQEKIKELELAIVKKDSSGIKKAFTYIVDKSVDLAIALLAGRILQ